MQNVTTLWNLVFQITKDINYLEYMKYEDFFFIAGKRINFVTFEAAGWKKSKRNNASINIIYLTNHKIIITYNETTTIIREFMLHRYRPVYGPYMTS